MGTTTKWLTILTVTALLSAAPGFALAAGMNTPAMPALVIEPTGTPLDRYFGVNDLVDGWAHIITVRGAVVEHGVVHAVDPDENGDVLVDVEVWYLGATGKLPERLKVGDATHFPHNGLAFASLGPCVADATSCLEDINSGVTFFSLGAQHLVEGSDDKKLTFAVPMRALLAAQGADAQLDPFTVWHDAWYVPAKTHGSEVRSDTPARGDVSLCPQNPTWNCPSSGGFFNEFKNALFFAGFGELDPYANEGADAASTPFGRNDEVVVALGGTSSSREAELGLKGHIDRLEHTFLGIEPRLTSTDITDAYATILSLEGGAVDRAWAMDGDFIFHAEVVRYTENGATPVELKLGAPAAVRILDARAGGDAPYECSSPGPNVGEGYVIVCGALGPDFKLNAARTLASFAVSAEILETAGLLDVPVAVSAWLDVSDHSDETVIGSYEPGNGFYSFPKLQLRESRVASTFDWAFTPVVLSSAESLVTLIDIKYPKHAATFGSGQMVTVEWKAPVNDFTGLRQLYRVEVYASQGEGVPTAVTDSYTCETEAVGIFLCRATVKMGEDEDTYFIIVRMVATQAGQELSLCSPSISSSVAFCSSVETFVDKTPPTPILVLNPTEPTGDGGWYTDAVLVDFSCDDGAGSGCLPSDLRYKVNGGFWIEHQGSFLLPGDGTYNITYQATDRAGNIGPIKWSTLKRDHLAPTTTVTLSPSTSADAWASSPVTVSFACADAMSGCAQTNVAVGDGLAASATVLHLDSTGEHVIDYASSDIAGNAESLRTLTVRVDLDAPVIDSVCVAFVECDGSETIETATARDTLIATDEGAGIATRQVRATLGDSQTAWSDVPAEGFVDIDLRSILSQPISTIYRGEGVVFSARVVDGVGHETIATSAAYNVNTAGSEVVVLLERMNNPQTFVPDGTTVTLTYRALYVGGPQVGEPVIGAVFELADASDADFTASATSDLSGLVTFHLTGANVGRLLSLSMPDEPTQELRAPAPLSLVWTLVTLERVEELDTPQASHHANPGQVYNVAYRVQLAYNEAPAQGARVTLTNGGTFSALAGSDGIVKVPTKRDTPSEVEFVVAATYQPTNGPQQTVAGDSVTLRWAKLVVEELVVTPVEGKLVNGWHDIGDTVGFSGQAFLVFGSGEGDRVPATDAVLTFAAGESETLTVDETGAFAATRTFATPTRVTPALTFVSTPQGVTTHEIASYAEQRWAQVVIGDLSAVNRDAINAVAGWHDVADTVDFGFSVNIVYGALASDVMPAEGAKVSFTDLASEELTVGSTGSVVVARTFEMVADFTPALAFVSTTQGVTENIVAEFSRQRWTEIVLTVESSDSFTNVGDAVTLTIGATWAHAEDTESTAQPVGSATITVADAIGGETACTVVAGESVCDVVMAQANDDDLTLLVASSAMGITRQAGDVEQTIAVVWTRIVVSGCGVDDGFVDYGATVTLTCAVAYEHDGSAVEDATIATVSELPEGCTQDAGAVSEPGVLVAKVTCVGIQNLAGDNAVAFTVTEAYEDVTATIGDVDLSAVWAKVVFTPVAADGWHAVDEEVSFAFVAEYVFGATEQDRAPAAGAVVELSAADEVESLTTATDGLASHTFVFDAVTDTVPTLALVSTTEGVTLFDAMDFGRQRWTEIDLRVTASDLFVNVGDDVTLTLSAIWAHDEDDDSETDTAVAAATVLVLDAASATVATCDLVDGAATCDVSFATPYAAGLTLSVSDATNGVTRQLGGVAAGISPIWTRIVISAPTVNDWRVNVNDMVTLTGTATYAHDSSPVADATIVFGEGADEACTLLTGTIVNGALVATAQCDEVRDLSATGLPLVVSGADEDVTLLSAPLALKSIWTEVVVEYTTDVSRKLLSPKAPVVFTANVRYAHDDSPVLRAGVIVKSDIEGDADEFVCITNLQGNCSVEVTKDLGSFDFGVTAFSTIVSGNKLVPDITRMSDTPATKSYRWTAIAFADFVCQVGDGSAHACGTAVYETDTLVTVTAKAVASDVPTEVLAGASVTFAGQSGTTDENGEFSIEVTRFTPGANTFTARGVSALVEGEIVTWTTPRTQTIYFE